MLNGPFPLPETIDRLIDGLGSSLPIIATDLGTYETAVRIMNTRGRLAADSQRRYDTALAMFERHVDTDELTRSLGLAQSDRRDAADVRVRAHRARARPSAGASCCPRATTTACCAPPRPCSRAASPT